MTNNTLPGMSRTEYIIWRADTRMQIEDQHPGWTKEQINKYLEKVEEILRNTNIDIVNKEW